MTQINAYLGFDGKCREAMTFYQECLGGELTLQTMAESPLADQMPAEDGQNILHSTLTQGDLVLMATDMGRGERINGNTVSLALNCSSEEEINRFFSNLSVGGQISCPLSEQFWGGTFGSFTDKYGMNWMLNYEKKSGK